MNQQESVKQRFSTRSLIFIGLGILIVIGLVAGIYWGGQVIEPKDVVGPKEMLYRVNPGDGIKAIADGLRKEQIIDSSRSFVIYGYITGQFGRLQAGVYQVSSADSPREILAKIAKGETAVFRLTVPEGYRIEQIAQKLAKENRLAAEGFVEKAKGKEGYLFPDTYEFLLNATTEEVIDTMRKNLDTKTKDLVLSRQDIIIASIVEREAKRDEDRPKVAAVYKNRTRISQNLESDPTVQYARDTNAVEGADLKKIKDYKFWEPIQAADLKSIQSPYNTYLNNGLPPGPICNPGIKSLQAVVNPEPNFEEYFYFFNLKSGETIFSKSFAEHLENLQKHEGEL